MDSQTMPVPETTDRYLGNFTETSKQVHKFVIAMNVASLASVFLAHRNDDASQIPLLSITATGKEGAGILLGFVLIFGLVGLFLGRTWKANAAVLIRSNPAYRESLTLYPCILNAHPVIRSLCAGVVLGCLGRTVQLLEFVEGRWWSNAIALAVSAPFCLLMLFCTIKSIGEPSEASTTQQAVTS
jgi:hypothetical protein